MSKAAVIGLGTMGPGIAATLARGWADRWRPLRVEYAGPIPYAPPGA